MEFTKRLRRLWRHAAFRRVTIVRILAQTGDGSVQVGMASYLLFNPADQSGAWAAAAVLALTMLPYSFVGPFVSIALDRFSRQRVALLVDSIRTICTLILAAMIGNHLTGTGSQIVLTLMLLIMVSLNRFTLAGLQAGLAYTVDDDEYLDASSLMPMIGPIGMLVGGGFAAFLRLFGSHGLGVDGANAVIFAIAALFFIASVLVCWHIPKDGLGPEPTTSKTTVHDVLNNLMGGFWSLATHKPAWLALLAEVIVRIGYGILLVFAIAIYRNYFFPHPEQLNTAIAQLMGWFGVSGAGFLLSGVVSVPIANRIGVRHCIIAMLGVMAISQVVFGTIFWIPALLINSFFIGIAGQSVKVQVDTVIQAHIEDSHRGRAFTIYDVAYNVSTVIGAVIGAVLLAPTGKSPAVTIGSGIMYLLMAVIFAAVSYPLGNATFNKGTHADRDVAKASL